MDSFCNTLTTSTPRENARDPCKNLSTCEYFGSYDILKHLSEINISYKSMPDKCTNLINNGRFFVETLNLKTNTTNLNHSYIVIVKEKGETVGYAHAKIVPHDHLKSLKTKKEVVRDTPQNNKKTKHIYIEHLCTNKTCRGAGRELINRIVFIALRHRCPYITLNSVKEALSFYRHLGFVWDGEAKINFENLKSLKLNVLWYFLCYVKSSMSDNDMVSFREFFGCGEKTSGLNRKRPRS